MNRLHIAYRKNRTCRALGNALGPVSAYVPGRAPKRFGLGFSLLDMAVFLFATAGIVVGVVYLGKVTLEKQQARATIALIDKALDLVSENSLIYKNPPADTNMERHIIRVGDIPAKNFFTANNIIRMRSPESKVFHLKRDSSGRPYIELYDMKRKTCIEIGYHIIASLPRYYSVKLSTSEPTYSVANTGNTALNATNFNKTTLVDECKKTSSNNDMVIYRKR